MQSKPGAHGKVFISYRREGGGEMARLIMNELQQRGYEVFMDVEALRSGPFNEGLLIEMKSATDVVVILSPGSLERCQNQGDWLRREIAYALKAQKNVVPVMMRGFDWPAQDLPSDINNLRFQNALAPTHELFQASMERLGSFLVARPHISKKGHEGLMIKGVLGVSVLCLLVSLWVWFCHLSPAPTPKPALAAEPSPAAPAPTAASEKTASGAPVSKSAPVLPHVKPVLKFNPNPPKETDRGIVFDINLGGGAVIEMMSIPSGQFTMGEMSGNMGPAHRVTIKRFCLSKFEITQGQYQKVMGGNPSYSIGDKRPVTDITWQQAAEYCSRLSELTKIRFTLPSEAQWEYACRAGKPGMYSWGDDESKISEYAWYRDNAPFQAVQEVGTKKPNFFYVYDMHGNATEYCQDVYHPNYQGAPADGRAWETPAGGGEPLRVLRSGNSNQKPGMCRSRVRMGIPVGHTSHWDGFRVACQVPER